MEVLLQRLDACYFQTPHEFEESHFFAVTGCCQERLRESPDGVMDVGLQAGSCVVSCSWNFTLPISILLTKLEALTHQSSSGQDGDV